MTYDEIKQKYAGAMAQKKTDITAARTRIELAKIKIENYTRERERYRNQPGEVSKEKSDAWRACTIAIQQAKKQLAEAEAAAAVVEMGADSLDRLVTNATR